MNAGDHVVHSAWFNGEKRYKSPKRAHEFVAQFEVKMGRVVTKSSKEMTLLGKKFNGNLPSKTVPREKKKKPTSPH